MSTEILRQKSVRYFLKNISMSVNTGMTIYLKCEIELFELSHQNSPKIFQMHLVTNMVNAFMEECV
jgi:hypothetical protein